MTMLTRLGGEWKTITASKVYVSGAWRTIVAIKIYAGGAWRDVANFTPPATGGGGGGGGTLAAVAEPSPCTGFAANSVVTTEPCTITPSGGLAPYTYAWSIISGTATIASPTSATTTFQKTGVPLGLTREATARCAVTDSLGTSTTVTVSLSFEHDSGIS